MYDILYIYIQVWSFQNMTSPKNTSHDVSCMLLHQATHPLGIARGTRRRPRKLHRRESTSRLPVQRCQMVPTGFKFTSIYHILQEKNGTPWTLLVFDVNFQPSNKFWCKSCNGIFETSVSFAKSLKEAISSVPRWPLRCRSWCYHAHGGWYLERNQRNYERIEIIIGQDSK